MFSRLTVLAGLILCLLFEPAVACGPDTDCRIGDRHYRIRMPAGHDGRTPVGAIVFAHGYTGNARQAMEDADFTELARKLGVAIISGKSAYRGWSLPHAPAADEREFVDELAYFDSVLEDAAKRFPIDRKRLVATGFSGGGMMVWHLACHRSTQFAGFVPISGTFWAPVPATCTTRPASVVHIHGDDDSIVPLLGRPIRKTRQGEVPRALEMYGSYGNFGASSPFRLEDLRCQGRRNAAGRILDFCLFTGGHDFRSGHVGLAWQLLVKAGSL